MTTIKNNIVKARHGHIMPQRSRDVARPDRGPTIEHPGLHKGYPRPAPSSPKNCESRVPRSTFRQ
jgi:hypothetical protein